MLDHGQVVAVIGEPGVGKTRLVYEFTRSHRTHDWLVLKSSLAFYGKATAYLQPPPDRGYGRMAPTIAGRAVPTLVVLRGKVI